MQQKNFIVFIVLSFLVLIGWITLQNWLNPPKHKDKQQEEKKVEAPPPKDKPPADAGPHIPERADRGLLIQLGDLTTKLRVVLDARGAGVLSVTLNDFHQADNLGKPVIVGGEKIPLEFVQGEKNSLTASNLIYHFPFKDEKADRPLDTLGKEKWDVIEPNPIVPGKPVNRVVFAKTIRNVRITKTYELRPGDYHIGLEVRVELTDDKPTKFRYQIGGAHGLRMEGEWYSGVHRIAHILNVDPKNQRKPDRQTEELPRLTQRSGGDRVFQANDMLIRYGAVATQFFVSGVVVDDQQDDQEFIEWARPTIESAWVKGRVLDIDPNGKFFELDTTPDPSFFGGRHKKETLRVVLAPDVKIPDGVVKGTVVYVNYFYDGYDNQVQATEILPPSEQNRLYFDDITVRLTTKVMNLEPGKPVVHKYLLYNGPVKVRLLADSGDVAQDLVERYTDTLRLDTFTDYHSNNPFGKFADWIHWTDVLIWCTNRMHGILWGLHNYLGLNYGLCIILLTLLVRSCMFPLSRKQTASAQRMQEKMAKIKPEIEKLKVKYKGDSQALKQAQTELMLKNGLINPLGSCWIMLLQMPIFMGLYYCLQESIHFRLAPFLWIDNLAAPDMLIWWTQSIPIISSPSNYSGSLWSILYLGPYFNLLPLFAVGFMIVQQSVMMPPPTDEQQATQQKMMKYMTIFFGLMFYKVAAGLCIYFIISSLWGFCERKLLPKKQPGAVDTEQRRGRFSQWMLDRMSLLRDGVSNSEATSPAAYSAPAAGAGRDRREKSKKPQRKGTSENGNGMLHKLRAWWDKVLKEARKK
jgi:YidC/Oxa1 family membrane protein insertase